MTAHDLSTWATLTLADARLGLAANDLEQVDLEGVVHWHAPGDAPPRRSRRVQWQLLQTYDELVVGYRHSGHVLGAAAATLAQRAASRRES